MVAFSDSIGSQQPSNGVSAPDASVLLATTPASGQRRLFGRAFYESIGSPKMVLAPMVDQSEFVWISLPSIFYVAADAIGRHGECLHDPT